MQPFNMENKVWKVGSRWSEYGAAEKSVLNIFRRNNYIFVGDQEGFKNKVHTGDYFAVADGNKVVAVARALDEPEDLGDLIEFKKLRFRPLLDKYNFDDPEEFRERCYAAKVHFLDLSPEHYFTYKRGTFFSANKYRDRIIELYSMYSNNAHFDISSKTYRIGKLETTNSVYYPKEAFLDGQTIYIVPVYQREYSWDEVQISRFIRDIFGGFWSVNEGRTYATVKAEPMFIGTMQLSQKRFLSPNECEQDIIDGQQRTSTLLCLFKYLSLKYPEAFESHKIPMNWLETRVNNDKEQLFLTNFLSVNNLNAIKESSENKYVRNCALIGNCFEEATGENLSAFFEIDSFLTYLLTNIYFVAVETVAGLSKTIQIFNTINTGGLDLNGDDLFKIRFYEYLRERHNVGDDAFSKIGELYRQIKEINSQWRERGNDYDVVNMTSVRAAYKDYIISRFDLPNNLYQMGTDTFFDYLFDGLLDIQQHIELGNKERLTNVSLSLEELNRVLTVVVEWNQSEYQTTEQLITYLLIEKSRYSRYTRIAYLLIMCGYSIPEVYEVFLPLSKIYLCYSVYYSRTIYDIHSLSNTLQKMIGLGVSRKNEVIDYLNKKLFSVECISGKEEFKKQIAYNRVWKDLICCLSAYFDEKKANTPIEMINKLLSENYDVEHIHATLDPSVYVNEEIQNSIGNLMLLEYSINRSIGNQPFETKKESYKNSSYQSIKKLIDYKQWGPFEIQDRLEQECQKIFEFIWGNPEEINACSADRAPQKEKPANQN